MTPESRVRNLICSWLRLHPREAFIFIHDSIGIFDPIKRVYRSNTSPYRMKGVSDILGIWQGRPLAIEVKSRTGRATPEQTEFLKRWTEHGGIGILARSLDDVLAHLKPQKKNEGLFDG